MRGPLRPLFFAAAPGLQQRSSSSLCSSAAARAAAAARGAAANKAPTYSGCMRLSAPRLAALEDYYVSGQVATCIQAPMAYYVWFAWAFLMQQQQRNLELLASLPAATPAEQQQLIQHPCSSSSGSIPAAEKEGD
ncbi:hypothetical protein Emag_001794 [Eimeria magna]